MAGFRRDSKRLSKPVWRTSDGPRPPASSITVKPRLIVDATCSSVSINPGDFRTQTQGGWGNEANGNNPGAYRDANFDSCFAPNGATIGDVLGYAVTFTNALAVEDFLPQGGTPGALTETASNPTNRSAGVLGGQTLASVLNVGFDACDPDFGASSEALADLVVDDPGADTVCKGMTVQDVLDAANRVLGGTELGSNPLPAEVNECADKINNDFVDGTVVGGYLKLP